jgi:N-acetylglucosaminyldiphosphoundecaprenol N-acetyl-beta-D-mannosaminyltransferase
MSSSDSNQERARIVSLDVNVTNVEHVTSVVGAWAGDMQGRYICVANVHMCMEAFDHSRFGDIVNAADLVVPDGRPLVWAQRLLGNKGANQVRGQNLTMSLCAMSQERDINVGLYGGSEAVLNKLVEVLSARFPRLNIAYVYSPPFRALSKNETRAICDEINSAGVELLFVGLGCPKQETWMADNKSHTKSIMVGVGAAFDFIAGEKSSAPEWIQRAGLEWVLRLIAEPTRLWRRYLKHNPRFVWHFAKQLLRDGRKA